MKQCPQCSRTYAEDFDYCLEDGSHLVDPRSNQPTLVLPAQHPTIPSDSPTTAPAAAPTRRSTVALVLGALGIILIILVGGGITLGLWWLDHNANRNGNSNSTYYVATASPSPSFNPLSLLTGSPSPSPSLLVGQEQESRESFLSPGTYECQITRSVDEDKSHIATLRMQLTFNLDGTYLQQAFVTIPGSQINDLLGMEEKGRYTQTGDTVNTTERLSREINFSTGEWEAWSVPKDGDGATSKEKVRNVTPNTFQLYDSTDGQWYTFSRV